MSHESHVRAIKYPVKEHIFNLKIDQEQGFDMTFLSTFLGLGTEKYDHHK